MPGFVERVKLVAYAWILGNARLPVALVCLLSAIRLQRLVQLILARFGRREQPFLEIRSFARAAELEVDSEAGVGLMSALRV